MKKPRVCELYRHFDKDGILLYVGISWSSVERLMTGHRSFSEWFDRITRVEIERYPSRKVAEEAELAAIDKENPIFNVVKSGKRGLACLSEAEQSERRALVARGRELGYPVSSRACLDSLRKTVNALEKGDIETAMQSTALS